MSLTDFERLSLINQYEILKGLHPDHDHHYDPIIKALTDGYLRDFENLAGHLEPVLGDEVRTEVREIFDMFRALAPGHGAKPRLIFGGFDGNEEGEHYAYASFLLEDLDLWKESQDSDLNSHTDMLSDYRKMLAVWKSWQDKWHPTADEIERIVAVAPHLCKPE
jgi:uncharacterized protein YfbU (UPF0304 family)